MASAIKMGGSPRDSNPLTERPNSFSQLPIEIQEMIFKAANITNWFDPNLKNMCLVDRSWASQIPHAILDRGVNRDEIVDSMLRKAKNNLTKIARANHLKKIAYKVRKLTLHGFFDFKDDQLLRVFKVFRNLHVVTIGGSQQLTPLGVVKALIKAKHLKAVRLRCGMTDETLATIAKSFPHIESVDLSLCSGVTEAGSAHFLTECKFLSDFRFPKNISFKTVFEYLKKESHPSLTSLDLSSVDKFDHDLFDMIRIKFPNLASIVLPKDQSFTQDGINSLLHCPIQYIKFSGQINTDTHLEPFIKKAVHLHTLHLSYCPELTDRTCETIAQYRPQLKRFITSGQISNKGLSTLVSTCCALEHLDLLESKIVVDGPLAKVLKEKLIHLKELFVRVEDPHLLPDIEHLRRRLRHFKVTKAKVSHHAAECSTESIL